MSDGNGMTAEECLELLSGKKVFVVERSKTIPWNDGSIGGGEDSRWSYITLVFATTQQEAIKEAMGGTNYEKAKLRTHKHETTGKEYHYAEHNNWDWCVLKNSKLMASTIRVLVGVIQVTQMSYMLIGEVEVKFFLYPMANFFN